MICSGQFDKTSLVFVSLAGPFFIMDNYKTYIDEWTRVHHE